MWYCSYIYVCVCAVPPLPIHSLHRAQTPRGAPSQLLKKTKKKKRDAPFLHPCPRQLAPHVCGWMQIIIIDGQLCSWKDNSNPAPRKRWKRSPCVTFRYIHNPVKLFWLLTSRTCFNVGNNFTTNASNILYEFCMFPYEN